MDHIGDEDVLFTYGDGVTNSNITACVAQHYSQNALVTVTAVRPAGRFGELGIEGSTIHTFQEKPMHEIGYINGGYMVLDKTVRGFLTGDNCSFEQQPLQGIASSGRMRAYCHNGFWQCMDTYREFEMLNRMWDNGEAPWRVW
jgi:glucose-1-phosphate cytidylyltransferase